MKVEDVPQDPKFTEGTPVRHPVYAVKNLMTVELLAHYADIPKRKVRKHMSDPGVCQSR